MNIPVSTYRLQLNASFTFKDLSNIIDYLRQLGISTIYASPLFTAPAGSMHGYDVADPHSLNSEIGSLNELLQLSRIMRQHQMTWLQDIVPNHMAFSMCNPRLADVFERGPFSIYYNYFDIDWQHPDPSLNGRVMVPFLGKPFDDCLQGAEITLQFNNDGFAIKYYDHSWPLSIDAYDAVLSVLPDEPEAEAASVLLKQLYTQAILDRSLLTWQHFKEKQLAAFTANENNVAFTKKLCEQISADKPMFKALLQEQYYQLSYWQNSNQVINYRRFFAVNDLVAINMADEAVFYDYHNLLYNLYEQQVIHGLRVDHIDGLRDPGKYLNRLRGLFGNDCYIIAEKILGHNEQLPPQWPLQGTTGYEFLSQVNWLLTNNEGAQKLVNLYREMFPDMKDYEEIIFEKKQFFLENHMGGEWDNLVTYFYSLQLHSASINRQQVKQALALFMCCLPVYRLYPTEQPADAVSEQIINKTFEQAHQKAPELKEALNALQSIWHIDQNDPELSKRRLAFLQRLMQFTGPLTAKGVEDTTFYVYNALPSHNEVGDTPNALHFSVNEFHECMQMRRKNYPHALNATSTHDTKRGEDGRIRLNMLSLFTDEWKQGVQQWRKQNAGCKTTVNNKQAPGEPDEYFIYQALLAGFPADGKVTGEYINRLNEYLVKSLREAKINSNWQAPDTAYEDAVAHFIQRILSPQHDFLKSFLPFFDTIHEYAAVYSLSQVLIKITAPGIPDIYQGSELWNTSYVDPDNRRPVNYALQKERLNELLQYEKQDPAALLNHIAAKRKEGLEKLFVTYKALQCRRTWPELFMNGSYRPLYVSKPCGIVAYAREYEQQWAIVAAPIPETGLLPDIEKALWLGICLPLPKEAPVNWKNEFTGEVFTIKNDLPLDAVFNAFPVALLTGQTT